MRLRRLTAIASAATLLGGAALLAAPTASAAPAAVGDLVCTGSQTAHFSPPLTNTPTTVTATVQENYNCLSLLSPISSGSGGYTAVRPDNSCLLSLSPLGTSQVTYGWNTGQTSTVTFNNTNVIRAANGTTTTISTGAVTSGYSTGSLVTRELVAPALSLTACATTGVSDSTGVATLTVLL
ncbi:hypothetical protein FKN01_31420 [Streptomyces sp. 130]|uniref:hypothetical protein n=1 Tax=Streptomyces sp. 130 TaxID=2591006 RepID=UPI001180B244|nr:hypothetical protein [Streptomyces sp. 130]TRV71726.1 hypothetical protein FKN01_31420 [Streptomyces sp. 130]